MPAATADQYVRPRMTPTITADRDARHGNETASGVHRSPDVSRSATEGAQDRQVVAPTTNDAHQCAERHGPCQERSEARQGQRDLTDLVEVGDVVGHRCSLLEVRANDGVDLVLAEPVGELERAPEAPVVPPRAGPRRPGSARSRRRAPAHRPGAARPLRRHALWSGGRRRSSAHPDVEPNRSAVRGPTPPRPRRSERVRAGPCPRRSLASGRSPAPAAGCRHCVA